MVLIKGKTLNHKVYEINVDTDTKISIVKQKFSELLENKLNMYDYKIIHLGNSLDDDDVITEEHESKLFIIMTIKKKPEDIDIKEESKQESKQNFTFTMDNPSMLFGQNPAINNNINADSSNQHILNFLNTVLINNNSLPGNNLNNIFVNNFLNDPSNNAMLSNFLHGPPESLFSALNMLGSENKDDDDDDDDDDNDDNDKDDKDDNNGEANNGEANDANQVNAVIEENKTNILPNPVVNPVQNNDELYNVAMIGNFSQTDTDNINEIVGMGFNYYEVIQFYTASGKDINMTLELLIKNS